MLPGSLWLLLSLSIGILERRRADTQLSLLVLALCYHPCIVEIEETKSLSGRFGMSHQQDLAQVRAQESLMTTCTSYKLLYLAVISFAAHVSLQPSTCRLCWSCVLFCHLCISGPTIY